MPDPLRNGTVVETCTRQQLPTVDSLRKWLLDRGLDTSDWGTGNTKCVNKLWEEIVGDESGLELWRKADNQLQPVRVTHVLRAKVCSPESHKRGVFLLNTWQQYGDGRKRIRNGLLSEKLTISEMPLEKNLHAVCERAVTQEEMQRLAESLFKITPLCPPPEYDPNYLCPLEVVDEYFDDHVIEVEASKSYPRLLTMYHLYTVDILCAGLPSVDFNTLEFDHPDENGNRKLKYVHAWVWTEWSQIQRYLFEGSSLKERKNKGSFHAPGGLHAWLQNFNLDLSMWGQKGFKSVDSLFHELEKEEAQLELWGRTDGVPLLMRVLHVLQVKVGSTDPRLRGRFLYHTWAQAADGTSRLVNRLMSTKLSARNLPFDRQRFAAEARTAIRDELSYLVDSFFSLDPDNLPEVSDLEKHAVEVRSVELVDHRVDVVESPTFKGLCTLYHLYTCNVECDGLPLADFASIEVKSETHDGAKLTKVKPYVKSAMGWCWVTWPQCLDMVHSRTREMEEKLLVYEEAWQAQNRMLLKNAKVIEELAARLRQLAANPHVPKDVIEKGEALMQQVQQGHQHMSSLMEAEKTKTLCCGGNIRRMVPPSMVSEMAEKTLISEEAIAWGDVIETAVPNSEQRLWCFRCL